MATNSLRGKNAFWKAKIPLKIKVFLWYMQKGVILTKDNLAKIHWMEILLVAVFVTLTRTFNIFFSLFWFILTGSF